MANFLLFSQKEINLRVTILSIRLKYRTKLCQYIAGIMPIYLKLYMLGECA